MQPVAQCGHCRQSFEVESRFAGGLVPCPGCGKAVEVPGLRDPLWTAIRIGGAIAAVGVGVLVGSSHGSAVGVATAAGALLGLWLLSRAF